MILFSFYFYFIISISQRLLINSASISSDENPEFRGIEPGIQAQIPQQNVQQFLPPGTQISHEANPPSPAPSGYIWVQLPSSYFPSQNPSVQQSPIQTPLAIPPSRLANPPNLPQLYVPAIQQPVTVTTQKSPLATIEEIRCPSVRGQFPGDACNKYINCWNGMGSEQFCPEGLLFNVKGYCDYPENVNCGGKPIQRIPPPVSNNPSYTTAVPGQSSFAPTLPPQAPTTIAPTVIVTLPTVNPSLRNRCLLARGQFRSDSCNKFVNCWDDVVIEQDCPEGLLFSHKGYCDYPVNVDCENRSLPPPSNALENGNANVISKCPLNFGTFREKSNCSNYYTCIGGQVVAQYTCPTGFSFNDNLGVCDYKDRVDCSKEPLIFNPQKNFLSNIPKDFLGKIDNCKPGSMFPLNPQCTTACLCRDGLTEIVQCPKGSAYDSKSDKCVSPPLAKC